MEQRLAGAIAAGGCPGDSRTIVLPMGAAPTKAEAGVYLDLV